MPRTYRFGLIRNWLIALALVLLGAPTVFSQTATVTLTTSDPDGVAWAGGSWSLTFATTNGSKAVSATNQGLPFTQSYSGVLNAAGAMTVTVSDTSTIIPAGSVWTVQVCPNLINNTTFCTVLPVAITAANASTFSAIVNASLPNIDIPAIPVPQGYSDMEFAAQPGNMYYNVGTTTPGFRCYTAAWAVCGTGGSAYNPAAVAITGGSINGTTIGLTTPAAADFTTINGVSYTEDVVASSATPAFSSTTSSSIITIATNVTSWTLPAGQYGSQMKTITWCENATGGFTVTGTPGDVRGAFNPFPTTSPGSCSTQTYKWTPSLQTPAWLATSAGSVDQ